MPVPKLLLLLSLAIVTLVYVAVWITDMRRAPRHVGAPTALQAAIGFVTNFFDTLGIGSFAPTTALFRAFDTVPDERIPGTLNVGHTIPTVAEAFVYVAIIGVDFVTLATLIAAAILGAWLGAGVVAQWPRRKIQVGMGFALLAASILLLATNLQLLPGGGEALSLRGVPLALAVAGNFCLGSLMTLGIGLYSPCLIMISLLGMNPKAAFPIMMGSCAFLMPVASIRFVRARAYEPRPALGLAIAGLPAVLIAAYVVRSLPLAAVRWLVMGVVLYTSVTMLAAAWRGERRRQSLSAIS
jgi:uncharacterized membrane protein YfcA